MDNTVAVLFSTTSSPFSWLIRLLTWSRWSHVSVIDGDTIIEAHALHGVIRTPLAEAIAKASECELVRLPAGDPAAVIAAASSQIGKPYDWTALWAFILRRDWQEDDSWFCSELVAWCFTKAGCGLFRPDRLARVTPEHLWMLEPDDLHNRKGRPS
jgi:uncharacterized protein YycO